METPFCETVSDANRCFCSLGTKVLSAADAALVGHTVALILLFTGRLGRNRHGLGPLSCPFHVMIKPMTQFCDALPRQPVSDYKVNIMQTVKW